MTKYITVTIEGSQLDNDEAPIVLSCNGTYHLHNDMYYVQYDEVIEEGKESIKNRMKISQTQIEMIKKGSGASQITFDLDQDTQAIYRTPYGSLCFEVKTSDIRVKELEELIEAELEYTLYSEGALLSSHRTIIRIVPDRSVINDK
jgi:uncharacterized beta-barrel protein YwiB (DUF1934 family)